MSVTAAAAFAAAQGAVTCATTGTTPCVSGTNTSSGIGVLGASNTGTGVRGSSNTNNGVKGSSKTSYGVLGQTTSGPAGVYGISDSGLNAGVFGTTTGGDVGVFGSGGVGAGGSGVLGSVDVGVGVTAISTSGFGVRATTNTGTGLLASSGNANGARIETDSTGLTNVGVAARGAYIGLAGSTLPTGFPIRLEDSDSNLLFRVDGAGNVFHRGSLTNFARTAGGAIATAWGPHTTFPTLEDTGTAQLAGGAALVRLDPAFAASIDVTSGYRVLLTPRGDTQPLFVATLTPTGFIVREAHGGRATVTFDYRILATPLGQAGQRMAITHIAPVALPARPSLRAQPPIAPLLP